MMIEMETYYDKHRPQVLEKARRVVKCDCGFSVRYSNLSAHRKTTPHIIWLQGRHVSDQKKTDGTG
jgi:hypothetical protein